VLNGLQIAVDFASLGLRPEVFTIGPFGDWGPFSLRWYSLSYIFAILGGWWLLAKMIPRPGSPMNAEQLDSFITWATLGVIVGGRRERGVRKPVYDSRRRRARAGQA
jgi:phosphatidylglycerol:prolipoprotein diacylglycerol transferase